MLAINKAQLIDILVRTKISVCNVEGLDGS